MTDPEFTVVPHPTSRILIRRGYEAYAQTLGLDGGRVREVGRTEGGRGRHPLVALPTGERVVIREFLRGGAIRHLNTRRYFLGHRAMQELRVTDAAARGGVRVPYVVAAVERPVRIGYTAALLSRWIEGAVELATWWAGAQPLARLAILRRSGSEIGKMHEAGVAHPDLNLRNLLVGPPEVDRVPAVYIVDFDKGRLFRSPVPVQRRRRDLLRIARSARKLRVVLGVTEWEALREGYGSAWPLGGFRG